MTQTRRTVIAAIAGSSALVLGGGFWRVTRQPQTAHRPWQLDPNPPSDVRLDAFRHAILAPNPHNRQPWLIKLVGNDQAIVSCDLDRRLPETDPYDRQITIGFGTFLELARIAAAERGVRIEMTTFPDGDAQPRLDQRPIASLRFVADAAVSRDPLYDAIPQRRSNKEAYDMSRPVPTELAAKVTRGEAEFTTDLRQVSTLRSNVIDALAIEQKTRAKYMESVNLIRIGQAEIDAQPDGIDLSGPMIEALSLAGMLDRNQLADMASTAYKTGMEQLIQSHGAIPAMVWITTAGNSRADQLDAGRRYVRVNLRATQLGLAMNPMSQALQEYPEMAAPFAKVQALLGATGAKRVQMLARIGYGPAIGPSPRWPMETHLRQ